MQENLPNIRIGEGILIVSGIAFLVSTMVFAFDGDTTVWFFAKAFYALGALLFLINR